MPSRFILEASLLDVAILRRATDTDEAIDILKDMVSRNLPETCQGEFHIVEHEGQIPVRDNLIVLATSTMIVGPLDEIAAGRRSVSDMAFYYEAHKDGIPKGKSICHFDGVMPWEVKTGWVPMVYKIGGGSAAELVVTANTSIEKMIENIESAMARDAKWVSIHEPHDGVAVVCAGGPSLKADLPFIKALGGTVFAVNGSYQFLARNGVDVSYHVMVDARPENIAFVPVENAPLQLYASNCDPSVLDAAQNLILWHCLMEGTNEHLPDTPYIGGGTTAGLKAIVLASVLGYRKIHLYGFDSCYETDAGHAYSQPLNDGERVLDVVSHGKSYRCAPWMITQAEDFEGLVPQLMEMGCEIEVHGTGLIPDMAKAMHVSKDLAAVYDLAVSPPTYDFLSFLSEAEKARRDGGYDRINLVIQPGPNGGFRDDNLPPDIAMRQSMLWRVVMGAARLLPTIGDISCLSQRKALDGSIFPGDWSVHNPVSHYGTKYLLDAEPFLKASPIARKAVSRYSKPYVTITIRNADYWPERNSNRTAWMNAIKLIEDMGYDVLTLSEEPEIWDIDVRAALYEGAVLNLGVSNGPVALMALLNCRYLIFKMVTDGCPSTSLEFLKSHGLVPGDSYNDRGRLVWEDDSEEVLIREITRELKPIARKAA